MSQFFLRLFFANYSNAGCLIGGVGAFCAHSYGDSLPKKDLVVGKYYENTPLSNAVYSVVSGLIFGAAALPVTGYYYYIASKNDGATPTRHFSFTVGSPGGDNKN